jgi:hypothetical protein
VPPSWVVPPCSSLPTAASFLPCPLFCAADAPAIYADFQRLAKMVDPFTTGDFRAEAVDAADRNTSSLNHRNASFEVTRELRFGVVRASTCSLNHRVVAILSVQNARASKRNYPPTLGGDVSALPDWFECRAQWRECVEASPSLTLTNQHGLTIWNAAGRGGGRGFSGHETSTFRVPRMIMVGSVADVSRALSNVTFQATRAHIGSNVVRLRVRDEASPFDFRESPDVMWRFDSLYRWEAWELQDCKAFCAADPLCFGFQWLEPTAAAVSTIQATLSLLGPFQYSSGAGAFSFNGQAGEDWGRSGGRAFPKCFFFEEAHAPVVDRVRPYVANARTFERFAAGDKCYADQSKTREIVSFLDVRIVSKADGSPSLYIPRLERTVQAGNTFHFSGVGIFDRDLEILGDTGRCSVKYTATRGTFTLTAPSSRPLQLSFPLGDAVADNPLLLVGRYSEVQEGLKHIYMTTSTTTPCGGQRCLSRDHVDVVVNDLGFSGYLGPRTHQLRVSLDVRKGPFNSPPVLSYASSRSVALAPGLPLLLVCVCVCVCM